jgi:hypothetical protein
VAGILSVSTLVNYIQMQAKISCPMYIDRRITGLGRVATIKAAPISNIYCGGIRLCAVAVHDRQDNG